MFNSTPTKNGQFVPTTVSVESKALARIIIYYTILQHTSHSSKTNLLEQKHVLTEHYRISDQRLWNEVPIVRQLAKKMELAMEANMWYS